MLLLLYLVVLAFSIGLVDLAAAFSISTGVGSLDGEDLLLGALLVGATPAYVRQRRLLSSAWFHRLELAWGIAIVFLAIQSLRSPADSLTERFVNLRFVRGYLLLFPTIAVLDSVPRFRRAVSAGVLFAILGTVLTIAQSLYGLDNMTDSPFYDIGAWEGNKQMVGDLARVNLPVSNWIAFTLLVVVAASILRFRPWYVPLGGFLSIAIAINFARSLWLAMLAAILVEVLLLAYVGRISVGRLARVSIVAGMGLLGVAMAAYLGFRGLLEAMAERLDEGVYYFREDAGNWSIRWADAADAMLVWQTEPLLGVGTAYFRALGKWIDLGYPIALVSVGVVGVAILFYLLAVCCAYAWSVLKRAAASGSVVMLIAGVAVPAQVTLMLVYQQWVDPRAYAILAVACGAALTGSRLFDAAE